MDMDTATQALISRTMARRKADGFRPGSAWDTWHKAGFDYASNMRPDCDLEAAALAYAQSRGFGNILANGTISRAFLEGARQALQVQA